MTTAQQLVIAIFRDRTQAEQAINELQQAGFDNSHLRLAGHGISTGGLLEKIKSVFTGEDMSAGGVFDDLVSMGTPPEDARYYQSEFETGHFIVAVVGTGTPLVAINILARHGGYGANQRFAQSSSTNYGRNANAEAPANVEEPANEEANAQPNLPNQRFAPYGREANEDVNAQPNLPNQRTAPPPDYAREANEDVNAQPNPPNQRTAPPPDYREDSGA